MEVGITQRDLKIGSRHNDPQPHAKRYFSVRMVNLADNNFSGTGKNFRCNDCGCLLFTYQGSDIANIIEGEILESKQWKEVLCKKCNILYRLL